MAPAPANAPADDWHPGDVIRKRRKARHWTIAQLAKLSGVNKATISALENGHRCRMDTLERLQQALPITLTWPVPPPSVIADPLRLLERMAALDPTQRDIVLTALEVVERAGRSRP